MVHQNISKMKYSALVLILLLLASCSDFLDKVPNEDMTLDEAFSSRLYAERYLSSVYVNLPQEISFNDWWGRNPFVGASDEMEITWNAVYAQYMNNGSWNPENVGNGGQDMCDIWPYNWEGIRKSNIFLSHIDQTPMDENEKDIWKGEALFLRAFYHFLLLRTHGPIPIVDKVILPDDDFKKIKRSTFDETVNFIVSDLNKAIASNLPIKTSTDKYGRATKAAALALKSRVLLCSASPLFNGNPDYKDFQNKDGEKLFSDYDAKKWEKAAQASLECIQAVEDEGYKIYYSSDNDPVTAYKELFLKNWNSEVLFAKNIGVWDHIERASNPTGMSGWSGYCPTQELVDAFEMSNGEAPIIAYNTDGTPIINPSSGYAENGYTTLTHPNGYYQSGIRNMYVGREPRFYAFINFNGAYWKTRKLEFWKTGRDGKKSGGVDYCITGYLMKKMLDKNVNISQNTGWSLRTLVYFRLSEIYLNYAEAINEAEGSSKAYFYVNAIRKRAGLPDLPSGLNYDQMKEKIRHERQIEFAFETHRYFDTRRWKISEKTDGGFIHGMNINAGTSLNDNAFYERSILEKRIFEKKHYLFPIPQKEMNKLPLMVQNPGW